MTEITLQEKELLQPRFLNIGGALSEYCFSNIFLFREKHHYHVIRQDDCLFIHGKSYDGLTYIMPGCELDEHCSEYLDRLKELLEEVDMIFPIPESWLKYFPESEFRYELLDDDMDYLFTREKLRDFPGRKLHKKRNLMKQFRQLYSREVVTLDDPQAREQAKEVLDRWQEDAGLKPEEADYLPCCEALELYDQLDLEGFLFLADGKPAGFTLGECVNRRVYGLHFAKADKRVKGIYQYMFSKTAELIDEQYTMLNLEQDLGSQPLRAAKSSYQPDMMAKKYRIFHR